MNLSEMIKLSVKGGYARSCKGKILKVHDTKEKNKEKYVLPIERFNSLMYFFFHGSNHSFHMCETERK